MKIPDIHLGDFLGKCWWIFQHHGAYGFGIKLKACWKDLENSPALLEDDVQWRSHWNQHFLLGIPQVAKFNDAGGYSWLLLPASLWCLDQTHLVVSLLETQIFVAGNMYCRRWTDEKCIYEVYKYVFVSEPKFSLQVFPRNIKRIYNLHW